MKNTGYGIGIKKGDLQIWEDFLALHQKKHVIWIFFMEQIIIRILEPAAEVWLYAANLRYFKGKGRKGNLFCDRAICQGTAGAGTEDD